MEDFFDKEESQKIFDSFLKNRPLIITGGSMGHVNPAIVLSRTYNIPLYLESSLKKEYKDVDKFFHYSHKLNFFQLIYSFFKFFFLGMKYKTFVLFGSYVCVPALLAAIILRKKIILHEQNSIIGKTNKVISFFSHAIFSTFKKTLRINKKYYPLGYIVNPRQYEIREDHILVITGTSPSSFVDTNFTESIAKYAKNNNLKVYHQTSNPEKVKKIYDQYGVKSFLAKRILDFEKKIAESKLVVSRSGAGSIAYALLYKKTPVLLPLLSAADNHQVLNSQYAELPSFSTPSSLEDYLKNHKNQEYNGSFLLYII